MYDICEPIELSDQELDNVAGGNPFSSQANGVFGTAITTNFNFAVGVVQGDNSALLAAIISGSHA
jgi:hypothetical protein